MESRFTADFPRPAVVWPVFFLRAKNVIFEQASFHLKTIEIRRRVNSYTKTSMSMDSRLNPPPPLSIYTTV